MDASKDSAGDGDGVVDTSHLDDIDDGCGCAEVWEQMCERRQTSD